MLCSITKSKQIKKSLAFEDKQENSHMNMAGDICVLLQFELGRKRKSTQTEKNAMEIFLMVNMAIMVLLVFVMADSENQVWYKKDIKVLSNVLHLKNN